MTDIFVRKDLLESATLRELCTPSNRAGALQTLSHLGAIGLAGILLWRSRGTGWFIPLFMLHGILLNFLYAGQHELSHWTVFSTRWLNEWVGRMFGFIVFYPRDFDQIQHIAHHRFTQDWDQDGELARDYYTLGSYLWWMSGVSYWYTRWRRILRFAAGIVTEPYLPKKRHPGLILESRCHLAGYCLILAASLWSHSDAALVLWLAPMLTMKFMHQLQNVIEHLGLPHLPNVLSNTRSTRTNSVMRWICWQMQYHTAHHAFPGVPFHHLKQLNRLLFSERGAVPPSMTYWGFHTAVIRAFAGGRTEADYPDDAAWIADRSAW